MTITAIAIALTGCGHVSLDQEDEVYDRWDGRHVLCAAGLDTVSGNDVDSVERGMDRAARDGSVLMIYTHAPGTTVPTADLDEVLSYAASIHLPALTFHDLLDGPPQAGYALSYDDANVDSWYATRDLFARTGARATLFVTRYDLLTQPRKDELRELADLGNDVEAHTVRHLRAPDYVEAHGLDAYLADEALPSIDRLRDDGYDVVAFAYPFGARDRELDDALLRHVRVLRSVTFTVDSPLVADPCPE